MPKKKRGTQENGFFFSRVRMRMRVRVFTHKPTNEGNEVSGNRKDNTVKEADLITTIKKYLATLPETFAWKEHGGQYGTAGCDQYVNKDLIEQYALYMQRTIQCQEGINQYGLLAKHPTTQMPIASPYFNMALQSSKQANLYWMQIYQIVKDNCETPLGNSNPNDDLMERLLG